MKALNDPRRVIIVNAGGRLSLSAQNGDYDIYIDSIKRNVDRISDTDENKRLAPIEVVKSVEEAGDLKDVDTLVFVTLGMLDRAKEIKKKFPHLKILVATGLLPKNEVIIIDKEWLTPRVLYDFVAYSSNN